MSSSLIEHITALRKAVMHCALGFIVLYPVGFTLAPKCINKLALLTFPDAVNQLNYFSPMEVFILQVKLGAIISFILSFPYSVWHISKFLTPALYDNERRMLKWAVLSSSFLFCLGGAFCVFFMLPIVIKFSLSFSSPQLRPVFGVGSFVSLCSWLILAFGLMFQFPLIVVAAVKFGLVSIKSLKNKRPYAAVAILILSAIVTPPDVVSQILLAAPTYLLFEAGLLFAQFIEKKERSASERTRR